MRALLALNRHTSIFAIQYSCTPKRFYTPRFCLNNVSTVSDALNLAESLRSSILGTQIHSHIVKLGLTNEIFSQNNLIKMYTNCGIFSHARKLFDKMPDRNLVSWTLLISGANKNGEYALALESFIIMMQIECFMPNEFALGSIMKASINIEALDFGLCIHCLSVKIGLEKNNFVGSSILHMYSKYGIIEESERLFESLNPSDLGCWNAMIGAYAQCGYGFQATKTVSSMNSKDLPMDEFTFIHALNASSITSDLDLGSQIHGKIIQKGFEPMITLMNSLIDMYIQTGSNDKAWKLFASMEEKDIASWNTILTISSPLLLTDLMIMGLQPNRITFSVLFRMCDKVDLGQQLFGLAYRLGLHNEPHVSNSLINMFFRCGTKETARSIFDSLLSKDIQNWNEMIHGYNLSSDIESVNLFVKLRGSNIELDECTFSCAIEACFKTENVRLGKQVHAIVIKSGFASNGHVCTSLVHSYAKFGFLNDSYVFFHDEMDITTWGGLISGLVDRGYPKEAIRVFGYLKPDSFIFGSILNACASITSLTLTKSVHGHVLKTEVYADEYVASALVDAYGKSGDLTSATSAFRESCTFGDVALFNTMIMAYANHGRVKEAMEVYEEMKLANMKPSQSTFVSVLSACSHVGLVDVGRVLFRSIVVDYGVDPSRDNYGCLVDLLARNGFLEEAKGVIEGMPYAGWPGVWRSFVNGCWIHGEKELGKMGVRKLMELFEEDKGGGGGYVLLSKIYCEEGNWEDGLKVRKEMVDKGIRKDLGSSWISV